MLDAVSTALRLADPERAHLYLLAGLNPPRPVGARGADGPPELRRLLDAWTPMPALVQDRYWNLLAVNDAARAVFGYGDTDHNCLITFFTNARYRDLCEQWESVAPGVVAAFRADAAHFPDDPEFVRVLADLSALSPEFADLWSRHEVGTHAQSVKSVRHPEAGDLHFDKTALLVADHPDWRVELYNPHAATAPRRPPTLKGPFRTTPPANAAFAALRVLSESFGALSGANDSFGASSGVNESFGASCGGDEASAGAQPGGGGPRISALWLCSWALGTLRA